MDWQGKKIVGAEYAEALVYHELEEGYSTTNTLKKYGTE